MSYDYLASPSEFARSKYFYALLSGYYISEDRFLFERRYYPAYEILLITEGKGWYRHGQHWLGLVAGDCLLHDMRYPHAYKSDLDHPFQMTYLVFDGHMLDKLWYDYFSSPYVILRPESLGSIKDVLELIMQDVMKEIPLDDTEMHTSLLIYQMLLDCMHQSHKGSRVNGLAKPDSMIAAQKFMNEHYLTTNTMEDIAKHVNVSYYHFIRQFKYHFGTTPKEYILLRRVNHAKRLLLLTNHSVTEIAELSGFNNYNSFLHSFHRIEKCSPTDYRNNWKMY